MVHHRRIAWLLADHYAVDDIRRMLAIEEAAITDTDDDRPQDRRPTD